jgi:hypothetical protein
MEEGVFIVQLVILGIKNRHHIGNFMTWMKLTVESESQSTKNMSIIPLLGFVSLPNIFRTRIILKSEDKIHLLSLEFVYKYSGIR